MVFNLILLLFVNHLKIFLVIYKLPDDWCINHIHETMAAQMVWVCTFSYILTYKHCFTDMLACVCRCVQYIAGSVRAVFALLCFVVVMHWLIFPCPSGLLRWHCGNLTIAPVPAERPWWIWINTSCEFIMNDCITAAGRGTAGPCAYFLRYSVRKPYNLTVSHLLVIQMHSIYLFCRLWYEELHAAT